MQTDGVRLRRLCGAPAGGSDSDVCKQTKAQQLPSSSSLFTRTPRPRSHCHPSFPAYATPNTSTSNGRPGRRSDRLPYLLFDIVGNAAAIPRVTALRLNASLALLVRQEGSGGGGELGSFMPDRRGREGRQAGDSWAAGPERREV